MSKGYSVGLVGEQYRQSAINRCRAGERVYICREIGNPHDPNALCVHTEHGDAIGHIARDNWVQRLVHEEERGARAIIQEIRDGTRGFREVVLLVVPSDALEDIIDEIPYR